MGPNTTSPETNGGSVSAINTPSTVYEPTVIQPETPVPASPNPAVSSPEPDSSQVSATEVSSGAAFDPNQNQTTTPPFNTPAPQAQVPPPIYNPSAGPTTGINTTPRQGKRKVILFGAMAAVLVLAGSAAAVFGVYIPNKPQNVWKTGLNRSGTAVQKLVATVTTKDICRAPASKRSGVYLGYTHQTRQPHCQLKLTLPPLPQIK